MSRLTKTCPVEKMVFIDCCFYTADQLLSKEDYDSLKLPHIGWMRVEDAADRCKLSPPTFRKRAKQWLMPWKYGKLPYEFFAGRDFYEKPPKEEDKSIKYDDSKQYNALDLPTLGV